MSRAHREVEGIWRFYHFYVNELIAKLERMRMIMRNVWGHSAKIHAQSGPDTRTENLVP